MVTWDDGVDVAMEMHTMCDVLMKHMEKFCFKGTETPAFGCGCVLE